MSRPPFARLARCLEACQWAPSSYSGQTTRAVIRADGDRLTQVDFYAATKSRYYAVVALGIWLANWETGAAVLGLSGSFEQLPVAGPGGGVPRYVISWRNDSAA